MQFSLREIRAVLREVLAKWAELLTEGGFGGDLFEMHRLRKNLHRGQDTATNF